MSVLLEFSMFPIAKGEGVSTYIGRIIRRRKRGHQVSAYTDVHHHRD
jgi:uncharacterized protein YqgV (UPF0045/DUF77 family)